MVKLVKNLSMKTLILSCNTGAGHNSSAHGIREYFESKNEFVCVQDALAYISPKFSKIVCNIHAFVYKYLPTLNAVAYYFAEKNERKFTDNFIGYKILSKGVNNLKNEILRENYDTVICTHIFSAYMLSVAIKKFNLELKTAFVTTDYSFTPGLQRSSFDAYFIPHPLLESAFINNGISKAKIYSTGIPVKQAFKFNQNKNEAKKLLNVPLNAKHVVISSGSMGCGPIKKVVLKLIKCKQNYAVTVVCGNNNRLKKSLTPLIKKYKNLKIYGFVTNMPTLLDSADVDLTKPGGLSVTEALVKTVPMVLINVVKGCEQANVNFFEKYKMAVSTKTANGAYLKCVEMLNSANIYNEKLSALKKYKIGLASKKIYETLKFTAKA